MFYQQMGLVSHFVLELEAMDIQLSSLRVSSQLTLDSTFVFVSELRMNWINWDSYWSSIIDDC